MISEGADTLQPSTGQSKLNLNVTDAFMSGDILNVMAKYSLQRGSVTEGGWYNVSNSLFIVQFYFDCKRLQI